MADAADEGGGRAAFRKLRADVCYVRGSCASGNGGGNGNPERSDGGAPCPGCRFPVCFLADNLNPETRRTCVPLFFSSPPAGRLSFHARERTLAAREICKIRMNGGCGTCSHPGCSVARRKSPAFSPSPAARAGYWIIPSKFDPRKVSGISAIAVVNSGLEARTRLECGF
jgi:hypothetical protein